MASPLPSRKKSVDLVQPAIRVSRIRRDPPPKVKEVTAAEIREQDAWDIVIGVTVVALALFAILFGYSGTADWSPSQHTIVVNLD